MPGLPPQGAIVPPGPADAPRLHRWWVAAALCIVAGLALRRTPLDVSAFLALNSLAPTWGPLAAALSVLALGASVFLLAGVVGLRWPQAPAAVLLAIVCGGLLVQVLKTLIGASRPLAVLGIGVVQVVGQPLVSRSMPSGHSAMAAGLLAMVWLAWPGARHRAAATAGALAVSVVALGCVLARAVVGAHWPSDMLVGCGLGLLAGTAVAGQARGRAVVERLGGFMAGHTGSRVTGALLVVVACSTWVSGRDYPEAGFTYAALALLGTLGGLGWWWAVPGPQRLSAGGRP